ncbi:MAG: hypothetical protein HQM00_02255 [Magnetococcales bacterium]|nr:hypothetical protein [Magnetococcales bacterium]
MTMTQDDILALVRSGAGRLTAAVDDHEFQQEMARSEVRLARKGIQLLRTDIGQYLIGQAVESILVAHRALETVLPEDTTEIRKLQTQAHNGRSFIQWLDEAIQRGLDMEQLLQEEQQP